MTDMDHFKVMLNQWGVPHKMYDPYDEDHEGIASTVKVGGYTHQSDDRGTVTGYSGFFTLFNFDAEGRFICMGHGNDSLLTDCHWRIPSILRIAAHIPNQLNLGSPSAC